MARRRRRIVRVLIALLFLLAILVAAAPLFANAGFVRRFVAGRIGRALGRRVTVGKVEADWGDGVVLRDVVIANRAREFRGEALLDAELVHLDQPLHTLIFGADEAKVRVEGLTLRVAERGGGRTNLDDIVRGLARPRRVRKGPPPKPTPVSIEVRRATIELRHLPPRPRAFNPYREDPVILPADAEALNIKLDRVDLSVAIGGGDARLRFSAGLFVNGKGGRLRGRLEGKAGVLTGEIETADLDLEIARPFLKERLEGRLALRATSRDGVFTVAARLHQLYTERLDITEDWVHLDARVRPTPKMLHVEALALKPASGDFGLEGSCEVAKTSTFTLNGHAPRRMLLAMIGVPPGEGRVRFHLNGSITGKRIAVRGKTFLEGVPETGEVTADAVLDVDLETGALNVEQLNVNAERVHAQVAARASLRRPRTFELSGTLKADIGRLRVLADPYLHLDDDAKASGEVSLQIARAALDELGDWALKASGDVMGLTLVGILPHDVRDHAGRFEINARLTDERNTLVVRKGVIDKLVVKGRVAGLREEHLRELEGTAKGSVRLGPMLAHLAGVELLGGTATVDVEAVTSADSLVVRGSVDVKRLRVNAMSQRPAELRGNLLYLQGSWNGRGHARVGSVSGKLRIDDFDGKRLRATVEVDEIGLKDLVREIPGLKLPAELKLDGTMRPTIRIEDRTFHVRVPETQITAVFQGNGFHNEPVEILARATHRKGRWDVRGELKSDGLVIKPIVYDADGMRSDWSAPADRIARHVPTLAKYRPAGRLSGTVRLDGDIVTEVTGRPIAFTLDGRRVHFNKLSGRVANDTLGNLDVELATGETKFQAKGKPERLVVTGAGRLDDLTPLTGARGGKFLLLRTLLKLDKGSWSAEGSWRAASVRKDDIAADDVTVRFAASGGDGQVSINARTVVGRFLYDTVKVADLDIDTDGKGSFEKAFRFTSKASAKSLVVDDIPFTGLAATLQGVFKTGMPAPVLRGPMTVEKIALGAVTFTKASADVRLDKVILHVDKLQATANEGTVTGEGFIDLNRAPERWRCEVALHRLKLTEGMGEPLGLLLPILRLSNDDPRRTLKGTLDGRMSLAATGTSTPALIKTMVGKGTLRLTETEVNGSVLLPLLTLRVDRALQNKPYRFKDFETSFIVTDGRVKTTPFTLTGVPFVMEFSGDAGLDGSLNFRIRSKVFRVPFRVRGTFDKPSVKLAPGDVLR